MIRMRVVRLKVGLILRGQGKLTREEISDSAFEIIQWTKRVAPSNESRVATSLREIQREVWISLRDTRNLDQDIGWKKWIVYSVEKERVDSDRLEIPDGAGTRVIIYRVIEPMNWRRNRVIESTQARDCVDVRGIRKIRISRMFFDRLSLECFEEELLVDP